MRVRRTIAAALVAVVVVVLMPSAAASAAEPVTPVQPIPDVPSNTVRMTPGAGGTWTATDIWKAQLWYASTAKSKDLVTIPSTGTKVAVPPKPITPPGPLLRGAGGPIVNALLAGFAIGATGLEVYGAVTGDDPLDSLCGTPMEGPGHILYMGFMTDCQAILDQANADMPETFSLTYGGTTMSRHWRSFVLGGSPYQCYVASAPLPAGIHLASRSAGSPQWSGTQYPYGRQSSYCPPNEGAWNGQMHTEAYLSSTEFVFRSTATQQIVASPTVSRPDPARTPRCSVEWDDGTVTSGTGSPYRESVGFPLSSESMGCKSAWDAKPGAGIDRLPKTIDLESEAEGGAITEIATQEVPDMSPDQRIGLQPPANGRGLVLERTVDLTARSCNTWEVDCAGWWESTNQGTTPGDYRCSYGGATVSLAECGPYRHTFDTRTSTPTITDPATGQPVPWSGPAVNPGTVNPGVTGGGACGAAWSWNPVDWVLNPIKCAFIPSMAKVTATQTAIAVAWQPTIFGQLPPIVADVFQAPIGDASCQGPHIYMDFSQYWDGWPIVDWYPLNACHEPVSHVATLARTIGAAILIYLTALGIVRRISAVVQAPGLGTAAAS